MNNLAEFINSFPKPLVIMDESLQVIGAGKAAFSIFGLSDLHEDNELLALESKFFAEQELLTAVGAATMRLHYPGSNVTSRVPMGRRAYDVTVFSFTYEEAIAFGASFEDVTDQLDYAKNSESVRKFLELIINSLPVGVTVVDNDMCITTINSKQLDFLKAITDSGSFVDVIGKKMSEIFPPSEGFAWEDLEDEVMIQNSGQAQFTLRYDIYGQSMILLYSMIVFKNDEGVNEGAILISEDITEKTAMEEELQKARRKDTQLETLRDINVSLKHEIFNILTPLSMNAELVCYTLEESQTEQKEMLHSIIEQTERLKSFIDRLSDLKEVQTTSYIDKDSDRMLDI